MSTVQDEEKWLNRQAEDVRKVFIETALITSEDFFAPFAPICAATGLSRPVVRRACRHLRRRGLLGFQAGLFSESTGMPAGAGYGVTRAGIDLFNWIEYGDEPEVKP